ncbi:MAG TPA: nicotinate (nicotinamide) nucleotide adenylyltransferase [Candidatus Micrarchaeaceae archaeon]|nr:nicotinate (nicotinamide) nucleotide adenylyltransferase [Candidatus Micrarchaeaceae archaeon]
MAAASLGTVLFGGTFDPPHLGHLSVIRSLREQTNLPVLVVPTGDPGHRPRPVATPQQRAEMVEIALREPDDPLVTLSRHEVDQARPSFTVDSVTWLRARSPEHPLVLALGSDVAARLPGWKEVYRLLDQVKLLVFERPGSGQPADLVLQQLWELGLPLAGAEVLPISAPTVDATAIRDRLSRGEECADLLPPGVSRYIKSHGLYRARFLSADSFLEG